MADLAYEILTDREKYPDDMALNLADGRTISVKEWRDQTMPKADFTRASQAHAAKVQELQLGIDTASQNLARALKEKQDLEAKIPPPTQPRGKGPTDEELEADELLGPLVRQIKELRAEQAESKAQLKRHADAFLSTQFTRTIAELKKADADLDVDKFITYSRRKPVVDVETQMIDIEETYRAFSRDSAIEAAEKRGYEKGREKGKAEAKVPHIPVGHPSSPAKPAGLPADLDALKDEDVLKNPVIQKIFAGE